MNVTTPDQPSPPQPGEFCTIGGGDEGWGDPGNNPGDPGQLIQGNFRLVYPVSCPASGDPSFRVGETNYLFIPDCKKQGQNWTVVDGQDARVRLQNFIPQSDPPSSPDPLSSNYEITQDASQSVSAGRLASETVELKLNVDFSAAGLLPHPNGKPFGSLYYCPANEEDSLRGKTVAEILAVAEEVLGGAQVLLPSGYTWGALSDLVHQLNIAFRAPGKPVTQYCGRTAWAENNLSLTPCPLEGRGL